MSFLDDTIAAVATPVGQGGIGIVRISGPEALSLADRLFFSCKAGRTITAAATHSIIYGDLRDPADGSLVDEVLVSVMRGPHSYTRDDVVEINGHGGMMSIRRILEIVLAQGARLAEPGEFTKRAFLNGRISLTQAEAVMDLIAAKTDESRRIALDQLRGRLAERLEALRLALIDLCALAEAHIDFPEDDLGAGAWEEMGQGLEDIRQELGQLSRTFDEARFFRDGLATAIVGRPNVGKSSLLNALLQQDRAIVTDIPGTTRDLIEECLNISGLPVRIMDTAGIRSSAGTVEQEGIRRSLRALEDADCILAVFDGSMPLNAEDHDLIAKIVSRRAIIVVNKSDLDEKICFEELLPPHMPLVRISTLTGEGLDILKALIVKTNLRNWNEEREGVVVTNLRQKQAIDQAIAALGRGGEILRCGQPLEILALELRDALDHIGSITGVITPEMILDKIFSEFCIGK
ncbi:MAG: tRNA uridine-5-carboxymethylaminomethyl(34) synthesis GTPase MnmE [Thermodesulfovibrio sp.]|nr:tRNA uridine-5-carboxymethylaminomethyl(34) synthesis GTPase MnmE [Thermodesulfovibrio sp.]